MNRFTTIVIAGLLGLELIVQAQEDDSQQTKKREQPERHARPQATQPGTSPQAGQPAPRARGRPVTRPGATKNGSASRANDEAPRPSTAPMSNRPDEGRVSTQGQTSDSHPTRARHTNFQAQPKPQQIPGIDFDENRTIKGSEHWEGEKYAAFRSYHPHRHDRDWYHHHYRRIVLICGGYYYWSNFCWYPAWGYDPSSSYYVYDGPIYSGTAEELPDQVVADVQSALQDLGYYDGDVDGILGPLTREALTAYQSDNGLYQTAAIDQPTLESLDLG